MRKLTDDEQNGYLFLEQCLRTWPASYSRSLARRMIDEGEKPDGSWERGQYLACKDFLDKQSQKP